MLLCTLCFTEKSQYSTWLLPIQRISTYFIQRRKLPARRGKMRKAGGYLWLDGFSRSDEHDNLVEVIHEAGRPLFDPIVWSCVALRARRCNVETLYPRPLLHLAPHGGTAVWAPFDCRAIVLVILKEDVRFRVTRAPHPGPQFVIVGALWMIRSKKHIANADLADRTVYHFSSLIPRVLSEMRYEPEHKVSKFQGICSSIPKYTSSCSFVTLSEQE